MNVRAKRLLWFLINIFLLTLLAACGGGGGGSSPAPTPIPVSVSVSPGQATVTVSATQQFTATVSGSSAGVTWSVNDVPSGNATVGTITAAGLYTAPNVPPAPNNTVMVKATSSADSTKSASASVAVVNPAPTISSLSSTSASVGSSGFTLTVKGSSFVSASVVQWNGSPRQTTFISSTELAAVVRDGDLALGAAIPVTVVNPAPGGGPSTTSVTFNIENPAPVLGSLVPNSELAGHAGFDIQLSGSNFIPGSVVYWNNSPRTTHFTSSSQLTASLTTDDLADGCSACNFKVVNPGPGGGTSAALTFTINNPAPAITSFSPDPALVGDPRTLVVSGTGFVPSSIVQWCKGNPLVCTDRTKTSSSGTRLSISLTLSDVGSTGSAQVKVVNAAPGGGSATGTLAIENPAPSVSTLDPASAVAGGAGFTLTVNGSNFVADSTVQWCNPAPACSSLTPASRTSAQLTATVPANYIGTASSAITIAVVNPGPGGGTSAPAVGFTVNNPLPEITSLSSTTAIAGDTGFALTIHGSGFNSTSKVLWNAVERAPGSFADTQLTLDVTAADLASAAVIPIAVSNPGPGGGISSPAKTFTIYAAPVIAGLTPPSTTAPGSAFTLTVTGSNFVSGAQLYFGSNPTPYSTTVAANGASLTAAISSSDVQAPGTAQVKVVNVTAGGGVSNTDKYFAINSPVPTVISLVPNNHSAGAGDFSLIVNGTNFFSGAVVLFNGHSYTPVSVNATQITATISGSEILSTGTVPVKVQNPAPNSPLSGNLDFTINPGGGSLTTTFLLYPVNNGASPVTATNLSVNNDYDCDSSTTPQPDYLVNETAIPSSCATADKKDMAALALNVQPWDKSGLSVQLSADHPSLVRLFDDQDRALSLASPLTIDPISFYTGVPLQYHVEGLPGGNPGDSVQLTLTVNGTPITKTLVVGKQVTINLTFDDGPDYNEGFNQTSSVLSGLTSYPIDGGRPIPGTFFVQTNLPFHGGDPNIGGPLIKAEANDGSMVGIHTGNGWDATCDPNYGDPLNEDPWACDHISHCVRVQYPPYQVTDANGNTVLADLTHSGTVNVNALESDLIQAEAQVKGLTSTTGNPITPTLVRPTYGGYPNDGYCECIQGLGYPSCTPNSLWNDPDYGVEVTYTRVTPNPLTKQLWDVDSGDTDACVDSNGNPVPDVLTCMQTQLTSAAIGSYWGPGIQTLIDPPNNKTSIVVLMHDDVFSQIAADYINQLLKIIQKAVRYKGLNEVFGALGQ